MSLPGVGPVVALTPSGGDWRDFALQVPPAAGLLRRTGPEPALQRGQGSPWPHQQGRLYLDALGPGGAAQAVARGKKTRMSMYFRKKIVKLGYRKATVATAHRLLQFVFYLLRDQKPYVEQIESAA